ncbi:NAD(P)-dependent oxidoreductase [Rhizobium laguerreae]|uniref:3-hydroxyisobutyrate dehydrogenase n=1 Tax=Rhizobium laguerreae TaxID=1076926 RepID=A0AAX2QCU1_9HYPH|nr:NAD(P)-dependent oxidoreductase [Rhizobium laguerreae]NKM28191.1 NAD-binding protein [Rhizobium laguerreae]TCU14253.1 3-hydroxyisobutyrate dehydrogenase [Rhizobium laguerreae]UFW67034.1 NAD(P)-dependent oxidoreductase [Rhizobium laguerreae]
MANPTQTIVAFIGLGVMGLPMAKRLLAGGFDVVATDLSADAMEAFVEADGRTAKNIVEVAPVTDFVITMLPNGQIVRDALLGDMGFAMSLRTDTLIIAMSSSAPLETRGLREDLKILGLDLIDAPVSGGARRAEDGSLAIMVGGAPAMIEKARPLLKAMGSTVTATGEIGSGHAAKALNNYVSAAGLQAACEAILIGREFGIDPNVLTDVLNLSTGKNHSTEVKLKPFIIPENFTSGFAMALMAKDIETAASLARQLGKPEPGLEHAAALWKESLERVGKAADHTEIYSYLKVARQDR